MSQKTRSKKYNASERGKARVRAYRAGPGKATYDKVNAAHAKRRREWLQAFKMARGCCDCGFKGHPEALQFDHVRGNKAFGISERARYAMDRIIEEIAKCEVVCANCHAIRTHDRRRNGDSK